MGIVVAWSCNPDINLEQCWKVLQGTTHLTLYQIVTERYHQQALQPIESPAKRQNSVLSNENAEDAYYNITPLPDFDVDAEEPIKARPFKPKFHMTMGTNHRLAPTVPFSNNLSSYRKHHTLRPRSHGQDLPRAHSNPPQTALGRAL